MLQDGHGSCLWLLFLVLAWAKVAPHKAPLISLEAQRDTGSLSNLHQKALDLGYPVTASQYFDIKLTVKDLKDGHVQPVRFLKQTLELHFYSAKNNLLVHLEVPAKPTTPILAGFEVQLLQYDRTIGRETDISGSQFAASRFQGKQVIGESVFLAPSNFINKDRKYKLRVRLYCFREEASVMKPSQKPDRMFDPEYNDQMLDLLIKETAPKPVTGPVHTVGIYNNGVSCYGNAIFQVIYSIRALREQILAAENRNKTFRRIKTIIERMGKSKRAIKIRDLFNPETQQDAHEFFLRPVIQALEHAKVDVSGLMSARMVTLIRLSKGSASDIPVSAKVDTTYEIGVTPDGRPLRQTLESAYGRDRADSVTGYLHKGKRVDALLERKFACLPDVLMIQLRRFGSDGAGGIYKNTAEMSFEERLDLADMVLDRKRATSIGITNVPEQGDNRFLLHAVVLHSGTLNSGHYTAILRDGTRWIYIDDDKIEEISREKVFSHFSGRNRNMAYLLFYVRESRYDQVTRSVVKPRTKIDPPKLTLTELRPVLPRPVSPARIGTPNSDDVSLEELYSDDEKEKEFRKEGKKESDKEGDKEIDKDSEKESDKESEKDSDKGSDNESDKVSQKEGEDYWDVGGTEEHKEKDTVDLLVYSLKNYNPKVNLIDVLRDHPFTPVPKKMSTGEFFFPSPHIIRIPFGGENNIIFFLDPRPLIERYRTVDYLLIGTGSPFFEFEDKEMVFDETVKLIPVHVFRTFQGVVFERVIAISGEVSARTIQAKLGRRPPVDLFVADPARRTLLPLQGALPADSALIVCKREETVDLECWRIEQKWNAKPVRQVTFQAQGALVRLDLGEFALLGDVLKTVHRILFHHIPPSDERLPDLIVPGVNRRLEVDPKLSFFEAIAREGYAQENEFLVAAPAL